MVGLRALLRYGAEEWRLARLTHKIHGHIGIYTTIGVKMGLYARELLGNDLSVVSFAGKTPPVSCLNDGLQIGAKATLGHGLIEIADLDIPRPEACFRSGDRSITLRLKEPFLKQIEEDIRLGVQKYGHEPAYWKYIQSLALKYWREWDRKTIFTDENKPSC
ncbi:MAG: formylmethanofuran dehydrogenase subunit E family protein [Bacteroidales bacterium]|nr:formylmethanofuran dehydrogenase subunit E family protein [Bacteroidales bacterium]